MIGIMSVLGALASPPVVPTSAEPAEVHAPSEAPAPATPPAEVPVAFTISGGATLGLHEAGYLYLATELLKRAQTPHRVVLTTGASAGSANSLIAALNSCLPPNDDPREDLGYQLWVANGLEQIYDPERVTAVNLFTQETVQHQLRGLTALWQAGLSERCDVIVAIPVTRLHATEVAVSDTLRFPRQTFRFVLRLQGRGPGQAPLVTNYVDPRWGGPQLLLPLEGAGPDEVVSRIVDVVVASAAFPIAFAPVQLEHCVHDPRTQQDVTPCTEPRSAWFVDGGVFDNVPLRTAHRLTEQGLVVDGGRVRWRGGHDGARSPAPDVHHVYLDPVIRAYPEASEPQTEPESLELFSYIGAFADGFVEQSRSHELYGMVEADPMVFERSLVALNRYPQASGFLNAFAGVFDEAFRRFDYTLGMVDAWADLEQLVGVEREALAPLREHPGWKPFTCMLSWVEPGHEADRTACEGDDLADFRILLQVALDRVHDACRDRADLRSEHPRCAAAARGEPSPTVILPLSGDRAEVARRPGEEEFAWFLRSLGAHGFTFSTLGLEPHEAHRAPLVMANTLHSMARRFARTQPDPVQRRLVAATSRQGIGRMVAWPADPWAGYAVFGTVAEGGVSTLLSHRAPQLRINAALQLDGLVSLVGGTPEEFGVVLTAGPELDLLARSGAAAAPFIAPRAGFRLGPADRFGTHACDPVLADPRDCTQPRLDLTGGVVLLEVLRAQLGVDIYPWRPAPAPPMDLQLSLGLQL